MDERFKARAGETLQEWYDRVAATDDRGLS
jgi:hypothetical protein